MAEEKAAKRLVERKQKAWNVYRFESSEAYKRLQQQNECIKERCKKMRHDAYEQFQLERAENWLDLQVALIAAQRAYDDACRACGIKPLHHMRYNRMK